MMKHLLFSVLLLCCMPICVQSAELAEVFKLHNVYSDHMVLQRDRDIVITGTAEPGHRLLVSFAGKKVSAVAAPDGNWRAVFPPMRAGGPYTLTVSGKEGYSITLQDILIGEVWLCSGQSNMAFILKDARDSEKEQQTAKNRPQLRLLDITRIHNYVTPKADIENNGWMQVTPVAAKWFSAIGYLFGRDLQQELQVPVGIINASVGGTPIETWISQKGFLHAGLKDFAAVSGKYPAVNYAKLQQIKGKKSLLWEQKFFNDHVKEYEAAKNFHQEKLADMSGWKNIKFPIRFDEMRIYRPGIVWFRKEIDIPEELIDKDMELHLGTIDDWDETYFNGYPVGATGYGYARPWWIPRVYRIPGDRIKPGLNTIAIRVANFAAKGGFHGRPDQVYMARGPIRLPLAGNDWKMRVEFLLPPKFTPRPALPYDSTNHYPSSLYNGMIHGLQRFPIRGVLWYQGEGNASRPEQYAKLFPALINSWRTEWNNPEMPFIFAQLSSLEKHAPAMKLPVDFYEKLQPRESKWAHLREVQTEALKLPFTAMAVTTDIGNPVDIHPTDKQTVAKRMLNEALRITYGQKRSASPQFEKITIEGNKIRIHFKNAENGLIAKGGTLRRFAIAGADQVYHWADAVIEGSTVLLSSPAVPSPVHARYAWDNNPIDANLYNKAGLPAAGFRTDRTKK